MLAQVAPEVPPEARRVPRSMRIDPSHRPVPDDIPQSMPDRWQEMLDELEVKSKQTIDRLTAEKENCRQYASDLRAIILDAYMVHTDLDGLAYLFDKALIDDAEGDTSLVKASHLVVDVMQTISARLKALDERAALAFAKAGL